MEPTPPLIKINDNDAFPAELAALINKAFDLIDKTGWDNDADDSTRSFNFNFRGTSITVGRIQPDDSKDTKERKFGEFAIFVERVFFPLKNRPEDVHLFHDEMGSEMELRMTMLRVYLMAIPYRNKLVKKALCYCPRCHVMCEEAKNDKIPMEKRHLNAIKLVFFKKLKDERTTRDILIGYMDVMGFINSAGSQATLPTYREWKSEIGCEKTDHLRVPRVNFPLVYFYENAPRVAPYPQTYHPGDGIGLRREIENELDGGVFRGNGSENSLQLTRGEEELINYIRDHFIDPSIALITVKEKAFKQFIGGIYSDIPLESHRTKEVMEGLFMENVALKKQVDDMRDELDRLRRFLIS